MKQSASYVLGVGALGGLVAHEIQLAHPHAPLTLLFKNAARLNEFKSSNSSLTVNRTDSQDNINSSSSHFPATTVESLLKDSNRIQNLIVSTKAFQTTAALSKYIELLDSQSNIIFIHNGMGVLEEIGDRYWPILAKRPNFFKAVTTHGAYKSSPTVVNHVGLGNMKISYIPKRDEQTSSQEAPEIVQMVLNIPILKAQYVDHNQFLLAEIEKLAVNACVNPLTALLDCLNGDLLHGSKSVNIMRKVLDELVRAIQAEYANTFKDIPEANTILKPSRLLNLVLQVIQTTAKNSSSMREDVRNMNSTEIEYINGYIVGLGKKHNISTPINKMLVFMIKSKMSIEKSLDSRAADVLINDVNRNIEP